LNSRIILILAALALVSCKAHKLAVTPTDKTPTIQATDAPAKYVAPSLISKLPDIRAKQVAFNTFSGKAQTKLDIDGSSNNVTLNLRIDRDKKIWVSITATVLITVEVARAVITPDSINIVNKLQGVYIKKPFSYVYQYAGNQITFKSLQAILLGNAMPELLNPSSSVTTDNANTIISGNLQDLVYKMILGPDYKVSQSNLNNQPAALTLQVTNSAFIQADNRVIPSQIDIVSSAGAKKINASLHYNSAEFDKPLDFPFSIPGGYTPVD